MLTNSNYHLLIIDDTPSTHQDFRKILTPELLEDRERLIEMRDRDNAAKPEGRGKPAFMLEFALQAPEGIERAKQAVADNTPFAAIFVGIQTNPGEDDIQTIERIWEIDREVQTVICTAHAKYTWKDLRQRFGGSDRLYILKKPFDNFEIIQLACSLCKKWNLNRLKHVLAPEYRAQSSVPPTAHNNTMNRLNDAMNILSKLNNKLKYPQI